MANNKNAIQCEDLRSLRSTIEVVLKMLRAFLHFVKPTLDAHNRRRGGASSHDVEVVYSD